MILCLGLGKVFSLLARDHIENPRSCGEMPGATHYGVAGVPGDGPFVELWFALESETIKDASYRTYGCPTSIASAGIATTLLRGKTKSVALSFSESDLHVLVGEIPEGKGDCPGRVISAIQDAFK